MLVLALTWLLSSRLSLLWIWRLFVFSFSEILEVAHTALVLWNRLWEPRRAGHQFVWDTTKDQGFVCVQEASILLINLIVSLVSETLFVNCCTVFTPMCTSCGRNCQHGCSHSLLTECQQIHVTANLLQMWLFIDIYIYIHIWIQTQLSAKTRVMESLTCQRSTPDQLRRTAVWSSEAWAARVRGLGEQFYQSIRFYYIIDRSGFVNKAILGIHT